jgi:demethylmenaquinone methyltransferase/2-methoxy-6-polyprenyl-1,4-benzoquinol methylase
MVCGHLTRKFMNGEGQDGQEADQRAAREGDKARLVRGVFERVAARYDLMNDAMSFGVHRLWKRALVDWLNPRPGWTVCDVASGTGDIAFRIAARQRRATGPAPAPAVPSRVVAIDPNENMLAVGRGRDSAGTVSWLCAAAEALPVADRAADAYTVAFGLRNAVDLDRALREAFRVLKPGGRFLCLEFTSVTLPALDTLYDAYSDHVIPRLGRWIARDEPAYRYLVDSIRQFPGQDAFADRIRAAGFAQVRYRNLSGGIATLHSAWRI